MQSNIVPSSVDKGKSPKRYGRSVGPNVTINNILTLDPEKYTRSPSTSKLSEDPEYERVKFLVEERARYWRDLKVLYNDYTLVKMKQKELLDSEDNYVNKHCIEETIKLSNALKLKIQSKCKDIIFITNLCGNSEVNRVVQSLADGEDIDSVLIKKQKSAMKMRKAEAEKMKNKNSSRMRRASVVNSDDNDEYEVKEKSPPVPPARRRSTVIEPKFFDSELHWCQYCNVFPPTIKKYLQHLHDESHKKKIKELKINESPWHKCLPEEQVWRTDSTDSVCIKAFNFFVPANGWFCQLCRSWMGDIHCAATHLKSYIHNMNLKNFQEKFPKWKQGWLDERTKALEKTFQGRRESADGAEQQQKMQPISKKKQEEIESSSEEEEEEPISRHRTTKAEMWVPNQKAFERIRKETNPTPSVTESSLVKMKVVAKKDRPAFIGKMPLINRSKKIIVKELPQNITEQIAISCEETDKLQKQRDELTEKIIRRNEEENEIKLKEFMKVAKKIKKGKKKKIEQTMLAECYNATEFLPIVEHTDAIENLIGPPALVSQWEAEANYEYHMRQLHQYNLASQMMQMSQPFLLDPFHAVALHNQQYYNSSHMISNQYENFEIVSRDDEQVYSQYIEFQNSPSSSPAKKMFVSRKSESKNTQTVEGKRVKAKPNLLATGDNTDVKRLSKDDTKADKRSHTKLKSSPVIQKPPCLNKPAATDLMPSFKETFLGSDNPSGYIASLLSSNEEVKIVCANEPYKRRTAPSKRKRIKKKKELESQVRQTDQPEVSESHDDKTDEISKEEAKHLIGTITTSISTPKKTQSLKDKINSIRKNIDRSQVFEKTKEESIKRAKTSGNEDDEDRNSVDEEERHLGSRSEVWKRNEQYRMESEESEEEGDVDKLIYYDMTSI